MAIADTITSMQNHTSNAYTMIGYGTDLTGINKNLENLSSTIFEAFLEALRTPDTLFNNLPKTSASGSNITLNNTAYAPMRITLNPTAISQTTYTGKNLFDSVSATTNQSNYILNSNGTITISKYWGNDGRRWFNSFSLSAGTYTISFIPNISGAGNTIRFSLRDTLTTTDIENKTISITKGTKTTYTFTISNNIELGMCILGNQITDIDLTLTELQVEKSSTATSYEPYVGGTASPNPSYPQDIHTISGNNSVVVEGKNLCSSAVYYNTNAIYMYFNPKSLSKTFTISIKAPKTITGNLNVYLWVDNTNLSRIGYISFTNGEIASTTLTLSDSNYNAVKNGTSGFFSLYLSGAGFDTTGTLEKAQIENNNQATTYTPYVSQTNPINLGEYELGTIGNYSNEFVRSDGENSFSTDYKTSDNLTTYTKIDNNSFSYTCNGTWKGATFVVPCEKNTDYFINYNEYNPNNRGTYCEVKGGQTNTSLMARYHDYLITFNSGENTSLKITITNGTASDNTSGTITEIMLNKGTTALPYVPYEKGWYYKQGIGKVVLDGTQNITSCTVSAGNSNMAYAYTTLLDNYIGSSDGVCDKLKKASGELTTNVNSDKEMFSVSVSVWGGLRFYFDKTRLSEVSVAGFKTWLSTNNITIYYTLKTPTYTKITGELASQLEQVYKGMLSYDGITNISQVNNDLAFGLVASAITKLS